MLGLATLCPAGSIASKLLRGGHITIGIMSRTSNAQRVKTVRAARNAPWAGLNTAAAADAQHVSLCLLSLRTRGRCDAAAAALCTKSSAAGRVLVIVSGWCSPAVVRLAAGDTSEDVRDVTFGMPGWSSRSLSRLEAPRCVLVRAAFDPTPTIRALAAGRTQTPTAMMWQLAQDNDPDVRAAVAANPNTSSDILTVFEPRRQLACALYDGCQPEHTPRFAAEIRRRLPVDG